MSDNEYLVDQSESLNELEDLIGTYKVNYAGKLIYQIQIQVKYYKHNILKCKVLNEYL
jgi:hypothetical protein